MKDKAMENSAIGKSGDLREDPTESGWSAGLSRLRRVEVREEEGRRRKRGGGEVARRRHKYA